jgi:hypothetical protein
MTSAPDGGRSPDVSIAVLEETVRAQGDETRRAVEQLRCTVTEALNRLQDDHDRITRLEGKVDTEVERAGGEHKRLFTITDGITAELGRLSSRDRLEAAGLLLAAVIAAVIGALVK